MNRQLLTLSVQVLFVLLFTALGALKLSAAYHLSPDEYTKFADKASYFFRTTWYIKSTGFPSDAVLPSLWAFELAGGLCMLHKPQRGAISIILATILSEFLSRTGFATLLAVSSSTVSAMNLLLLLLCLHVYRHGQPVIALFKGPFEAKASRSPKATSPRSRPKTD